MINKVTPKTILYIPKNTNVNFSKNFKNSFIVRNATKKDTIKPIINVNKFASENS